MKAARILPWAMRPRRSWKKEAWFMAGTTGAATAIGAATGGKKGAAIGAISGGVARLIYRIATR